jgi:hypothetical protein
MSVYETLRMGVRARLMSSTVHRRGYGSRGLQEDGSSANWRCNRVSEIASAPIADEL